MTVKITRFPQSCILVETEGKRILIDPGSIQYKETYPDEKWNNIDIILVTHKHGDHCHPNAINAIMKNPKTKFYTTKEVSNTYPELKAEIIKEGDIITIDNIKIEVVKAIHGYIPFLKGGKEIHENVGYIIDDGTNRIYQTSDTICFENDYKCNILFVPVSNHGLVMGPFEAAQFAKETEAKVIIPIHYDNTRFPTNLTEVEKLFKEYNINLKILEIEENIDI